MLSGASKDDKRYASGCVGRDVGGIDAHGRAEAAVFPSLHARLRVEGRG